MFPDQHNCTTSVPSRTSIVVMSAFTVLAGGGTAYVVTGPVFDGRHLVGSRAWYRHSPVHPDRGPDDAGRPGAGSWLRPGPGPPRRARDHHVLGVVRFLGQAGRDPDPDGGGGYVPPTMSPPGRSGRLMLPGWDNFERRADPLPEGLARKVAGLFDLTIYRHDC